MKFTLYLFLIIYFSCLVYASKIEILVCSDFARGHLNPHLELVKNLLQTHHHKYHITFGAPSSVSSAYNVSYILQQEMPEHFCQWSPSNASTNDCNLTFVQLGDTMPPFPTDMNDVSPMYYFPILSKMLYMGMYENFFRFGNNTNVNRPRIPQVAIFSSFGLVNIGKFFKQHFPQTTVLETFPGDPHYILSALFGQDSAPETPNPLLITLAGFAKKKFSNSVLQHLPIVNRESISQSLVLKTVNKLFHQFVVPHGLHFLASMLPIVLYYGSGSNKDPFFIEHPEFSAFYSPFETMKKSTMLLFGSQHMEDNSVTIPKNWILLGIHLSKQPSVPSETNPIRIWLENQKQNKVIFASMGSQWQMTEDEIIIFRNGLLKYCNANQNVSILWRVKPHQVDIAKEGFEQVSCPSLIDSQWMPQQWILNHPSVQLFLTHCGMNSITEGIFYGTPLLGFPLGADQFAACQKLTDSKVMNQILHPISAEKIQYSIQETLSNIRLQNNIATMSEKMQNEKSAAENLDSLIEESLHNPSWKEQFQQIAEPQQDVITKYMPVLISLVIFWIIIMYISLKCCVWCCRKRT